MKHSYFKLILSIVCCELVGILGSVFTFQSIPTWYATLNKPFFSPPNWVFGPVWTLLYFFMGVSIYNVWNLRGKQKLRKSAISYFFIQLFFNFIWTPVFFGLQFPGIALVIIVAMWISTLLTIKTFFQLSKLSAMLLIPYLIWISFATLLNAAIVYLN